METDEKRRAQLGRASQLQTEILQGTERGEPVERLFLKAVECIVLREGDLVTYQTVYDNLKTVYGLTGLQEPVPMQVELEETQERLKKLEESCKACQATETRDTLERLKSAVRAHEARIARLQNGLRAARPPV